MLTLGLIAKFFWPLIVFDMPLGYDVGIYRYLFLKHAQGFPPFVVTDLEPWARGHPLGLFFFSTMFLRMGLPVDWLIGWIWNCFPVVLALSLGWIIGHKEGKVVGVLALLAALLSIAYFDGFAEMYWKTYASLFFCVWTYYFLERKSLWAIVCGIFTLAIHHQTGLLFALAVASWALLPLIPFSHTTPTKLTKQQSKKHAATIGFFGFLMLFIGMLWYVPVWDATVMAHIVSVFRNDTTSIGTFPPALFYVRTSGILLALGAYGFARSVMKERWTLWQMSVLWSFLFVALKLFFYRRFFLQLDFFLLPFAAIGIVDLWKRAIPGARGILIFLLFVQLLLTQRAAVMKQPLLDLASLSVIEKLSEGLPRNTMVIALENESVMLLRGWLPEHRVGGPGLFDVPWNQQQWETFILGSHEDRSFLLRSLHSPVILFVAPFFLDYYGPFAESFLRDPCFTMTEDPHLYHVTCIDTL